MPSSVNVTPGPGQSTHHISLSNGVETWGGILDKGPQGIQEIPQTPSSLYFNSQAGRYGDFGPGMGNVEQDDWSGGRGAELLDTDKTRYFDSRGAWTLTPERLLPAPQWKLVSGPSHSPFDLPGDMTWRRLMGYQRFLAVKVIPTANQSSLAIYLWIRRRGVPHGQLTVELHTDTAGAPSVAVLRTGSAQASDFTDVLSEFWQFGFASQAIVAGTTYWIVVYGAATDDAASHWEVGTHYQGSVGAEGAVGGTWFASDYPPYYLLSQSDNTEMVDRDYRFFELEGAWYFVDRHLPDTTVGSGNSTLEMQGDRGTAIANGGDKTKLNDGSTPARAWTVNTWAGAKVKIVAGPGQGEWRTISSNTATALTVFPAWNVTHTTATRYVIYDTNTWNTVAGLPANFTVTDFCVVDNICYFACGGSTPIRQMRNNAATGANEFNSTEVATATLLRLFYNPDHGRQLWRTHPSISYVSHADLMGPEEVINGAMALDANWTKGGGWTIAAGAATGAAATSDLTAAVAPLTAGRYYQITFTLLSRTAGTVAPVVGGVVGTARSVPGTYTEIILATTTALVLRGVGFSGTLTNVSALQALSVWGAVLIFDKPVAVGDSSKLITNLMPYDDEMFCFKEDSLWRLVNDRAAHVQVGLDSMAMPSNGLAACTAGLYLYFSWSYSLERMYGAVMDDIGPWRDQGLPSNRAGVISAMVPVMGWIIYAIDAGQFGYSSVMIWDGHGHHEIFRAWETNRRIRSIQWVPVRGGRPKLFINCGTFNVFLTFPKDALHPLRDAGMTFHHEAVVETATIDMGRARLPKFIKEVEAITEGLALATSSTAVGREISVDYAYDTTINTGQWVPAGDLNESPADAVQVNLAGVRQVRLRLRIQTVVATAPTIVRSLITELFARTPVKYQYHLRLKTSTLQRTITGQVDNNPDEFVEFLKRSAASAEKIRVRSVLRQWDDKLVIIEPPSIVRTFLNNILGWWGGVITVVVRDV